MQENVFSREEAQNQFTKVLKNVAIFGEYWHATKSLLPDELPFAWIQARVKGLINVRVMISDKRILVYEVGLRAASISLKQTVVLSSEIMVTLEKTGSRYANIRVTSEDEEILTINKIPCQIAARIVNFVNLPNAERRNALREVLHEESKSKVSPTEATQQNTTRSRAVAKDLSILPKRTREAAEEHIGGSRVVFTLLGLYGQALIALEDRLLIVKPGFLAGALGGVRITSFLYEDITAIELNTGIFFGVIEIGTPSYVLSQSRDFWTAHPDKDPAQANNCLPIDKTLLREFRPYIEKLREFVKNSKKRSVAEAQSESIAAQLSQLGELYKEGLLTEEEYRKAKDKLLGLTSDD